MKNEIRSAIALLAIIVIAKYVFDFSDATIAICALIVLVSVLFSEIRSLKNKIADMERQLNFLVKEKLQ